MSFYEEIIKRAKELGGDADWHDMTVGHGTFERVLIVTAPLSKAFPRPASNKLSTLTELTEALTKSFNLSRK